MGLFDGMFGGGDMKEAPGPVEKHTKAGKEASDWLLNLLRGDAPLQGVAGMAPGEEMGQSILMKLLGGGMFEDPRTSQYYQGMRQEMMREEEEGVSRQHRKANRSGMAKSSPYARAEMDFRRDMIGQRMSLLGGLYDRERQRDNPYTRLAAAQRYGALPRELEQAGLNAQYQQQLFPYQYQRPVANDLLNYQPWYQPQFYEEPSRGAGAFSGAVSGAMQGGQMGGPWGALAGGILGGVAGYNKMGQSAGKMGGMGGGMFGNLLQRNPAGQGGMDTGDYQTSGGFIFDSLKK